MKSTKWGIITMGGNKGGNYYSGITVLRALLFYGAQKRARVLCGGHREAMGLGSLCAKMSHGWK